MSTICFTGKGIWPGPTLSGFTTSKALTRTEWAEKAEVAGHRVTEKAEHADILVASRHDTVKSRNARARGARVITYGEFAAMLESGGVAAPDMAAPAVTLQPAKPPRSFIDTSEMEGSELWGQF